MTSKYYSLLSFFFHKFLYCTFHDINHIDVFFIIYLFFFCFFLITQIVRYLLYS